MIAVGVVLMVAVVMLVVGIVMVTMECFMCNEEHCKRILQYRNALVSLELYLLSLVEINCV
jgi:hypothetical protein